MKQNAYLRHLANYVLTVEAGSMTAAAEKVGGNPSAMSESVKILENYYGDVLLERRQSGVVPTSKGISVYEYARKMVEAANDALQINNEVKPSALKISMPREIACNWFTGVFSEIDRHSDIAQLTLLCEDELLDHDRYSRDLFVRAGSGALPSNIHILHEHQTSAVFATHVTNAKSFNVNRIKEIQNQTLLCKPQIHSAAKFTFAKSYGSIASRSMREKKQVELTFKNTIHIDDIQSRISLARSGLGVICCLFESLRKDFERGDMVQLSPKKLSIPISVQIATTKKNPSTTVKRVAMRLSQWLEGAAD